MGRPSTFTQAIADEICTRIANGESLREICRGENTPAQSSVFKWLNENKDFAEQYARARESQADVYADAVAAIADETPIMAEKGIDSAWVNWQRLRIDARKWTAGKLAPKKYGERVLNEHSGQDGGPMLHNVVVEFVRANAEVPGKA